MFEWLQKKKVAPIYMAPGDTLTIEYWAPERSCEVYGPTESLSTTVSTSCTVDEFAIGYFEEELGYERGYLGVFGKSKD